MLWRFQTDTEKPKDPPSSQVKRKRDVGDNGYYDGDVKQKKAGLSEDEKERILQMVENEPEVQ